MLAINSADDELNPPETGILDRAIEVVPGACVLLIPASGDTRGHGTVGTAKFWSAELKAFLDTAPMRAPKREP